MAVADLIRELSLQFSPEMLIRRSQELVLGLLPPAFAVFWALDDHRWRIVSQVGDLRNPQLQAVMDAGLPYETGWSNRVPWESGEPLYLDAYDPDLEHPSVRAEQVATTVSFPVMVNGSPCGIFGIGLFEQRRWSNSDKIVIETVARSLATGLELADVRLRLLKLAPPLQGSTSELSRDQLIHLAYHDPLTALPNRALFMDRLVAALEQRVQTHQPIAVLYIDLDRLKEINDMMGHEAGDALLCEVAQRLLRSVRPVDTVARQGGDEFTVVINGFDQPEDISTVVEDLRSALAKPYTVHGHPVEVTASIGVSLTALEGGDAQVLLRQADDALYQAKQAGKNRVQFHRSFRP